jgi:hypothetical protein
MLTLKILLQLQHSEIIYIILNYNIITRHTRQPKNVLYNVFCFYVYVTTRRHHHQELGKSKINL